MTEYIGEERRILASQGWHLKKEISVSVIISVIGIAVAGLTAYSDLKKDIELIKADGIVLHQRDTQANNDLKEALAQVREQFNQMNAKLDRLIERSHR